MKKPQPKQEIVLITPRKTSSGNPMCRANFSVVSEDAISWVRENCKMMCNISVDTDRALIFVEIRQNYDSDEVIDYILSYNDGADKSDAE